MDSPGETENVQEFSLPPNWNYLRSVQDTPFRKTFQPEEQDFYGLRQQCLQQKVLFEDPLFPCTEESLQLVDPVVGDKVEWKRPKDVPGVTDPKFIEDDISRFDIMQGDLGDCWFLSTVASLTLHPELVRKIVPVDQSFEEGEYAGIFHFRFWKCGKWVDIVVDDRLPILAGNRRLAFDYSSAKNEFWSALMEKAYAKFYGSYGAIDGGFSSEAMTDLTGGVVIKFQLNESSLPSKVFKVIERAFMLPTIVACGILSISPEARALGLVGGHAYSVTGVQVLNEGEAQLVRIRNPWGKNIEWTGKWSDGSPEWEGRDMPSKPDGEFWMSVQDFTKYFCILDVCHYSSGQDSNWREMILEGSWVKDVNSGGSRKHDIFHTNPQYKFKLSSDDTSKGGSLIVSVMQINRREQRKQCLPVGIDLFQLQDEGKPLEAVPGVVLKGLEPIPSKSRQYSGRRDECSRYKLQAGTYCIVPSCWKPGQEAEFILRLLYHETLPLSVFKPLQTGLVDTHSSFFKISKGKNEITPSELHALITKMFKNGVKKSRWDWAGRLWYAKKAPVYKISPELCQGLVDMFDADGSRSLSYEEFARLWQDVAAWKKIFEEHDPDMSRTIPIKEVQRILADLGLDVIDTKVLKTRNIPDDHQLDFESSLSFALQILTKT